MKVAIHQPHYFPWLGYFDKMAKVDKFIVMDMVQFVPRSYMSRNSFINRKGEVQKLSITVSKHGYRDKKVNDMELLDCAIWQNKHKVFFENNYKYFEYYNEIMEHINHIFTKKYENLFDVLLDTILAIKEMLGMETVVMKQSELYVSKFELAEVFDENDVEQKHKRQCMDVVNICRAADATQYITGTGASLGFISEELFSKYNIELAIQEYKCPQYDQKFTTEFVPNISALDMLFNCGIEKSREIFWNTVRNTNEFNKG